MTAILCEKKGKLMVNLEELEQKVLQILHKNKELQIKINELAHDNTLLREKSQQMEASIMRENSIIQNLENEKNAMKSSIEAILTTINSLENAS